MNVSLSSEHKHCLRVIVLLVIWMQEYSSEVTTLTRKDKTKYVPVSSSSDDVPQMVAPPVTSVKNNVSTREPVQQQTLPMMNRSIIQRSVSSLQCNTLVLCHTAVLQCAGSLSHCCLHLTDDLLFYREWPLWVVEHMISELTTVLVIGVFKTWNELIVYVEIIICK